MATKRKVTKKAARKRNGLVLAQDLNKREGQRGYVYLIWDGKRHDFRNRAARSLALKTLQAEKYGPLRSAKTNPLLSVPTIKEIWRRYYAGQSPAAIGKGLHVKASDVKRIVGAKKNPVKREAPKKTGARKRNGSDLEAAAKMFKKFHGKQATRVRTVEQLRVTPSALADCGKMVDLVVATDTGAGVRLPFRGTRLGCTGNGGQLYFIGGDQAINLRQFPNVSGSKDHVDLGEVVSICYHTSKDFHNFEKSDYEHEFGEEGGARPLLAYDVHSKRLYLVGGDYIVKREGIVD
jgi:hypothetical protein